MERPVACGLSEVLVKKTRDLKTNFGHEMGRENRTEVLVPPLEPEF